MEMSAQVSQKRRPHTHRSRSVTRNSSRRVHTSRPTAVLHFTDLNINYDSETSVEDSPATFRNHFSPRRPQKKEDMGLSPPPVTVVVLPEPTLSIIDFNFITRGDIERATNRKVTNASII